MSLMFRRIAIILTKPSLVTAQTFDIHVIAFHADWLATPRAASWVSPKKRWCAIAFILVTDKVVAVFMRLLQLQSRE